MILSLLKKQFFSLFVHFYIIIRRRIIIIVLLYKAHDGPRKGGKDPLENPHLYTFAT